jgi:hypothetical protein
VNLMDALKRTHGETWKWLRVIGVGRIR